MRKLVRDLFTEADNQTWDLGRVQGTIGFAVFLGLSVWAYGVHGDKFDPQSWGIGFGSVSLAFGGMIWMKGKEQPSTTATTTTVQMTPSTIEKTTEVKQGEHKP